MAYKTPPCPFCGNTDTKGRYSGKSFQAGCRKCNLLTPFHSTVWEAEYTWNFAVQLALRLVAQQEGQT